MARFLTFPAGKRSKFVVAAVFFLITAVIGGAFSGKFEDAQENETVPPARQGRVGQVDRGRQALPGRRAGARGDRLRAPGRAQRRRPPPGGRGPALVPDRPALDRPAAAEAAVLRERGRRAVLDADPRDRRLRALRGGDGRDPRPRERRARRADGESDRRRRLRRRRDQGVREHQRHAARRDRPDRPDPAGHHLPLADLLGDPVLHGAAGRVLRPRVRVPDRRGGRDHQRAVRGDFAGARLRRGHGLRAVAREPLSRGTAATRTSTRRCGSRCRPPARRSSPPG